jgi:quercetin dioxygenase-like cupin family protein
MKRKIALGAVGALLIAAGVALATPGSGVISAPIHARAAFPEGEDVSIKMKVNGHSGNHVIKMEDPSDMAVQQVVIAPGGHTGWHSHYGPVIVLVKSGELTLYRGDDPKCMPHTFGPGEAFVDRGGGAVHIARNLSKTDNVEFWPVYFDIPPGVPSPRIDAPYPGNCSF